MVLLVVLLVIITVVAMNMAIKAERLARSSQEDINRLRAILIQLRRDFDDFKSGGVRTKERPAEPDQPSPKEETAQEPSARQVEKTAASDAPTTVPHEPPPANIPPFEKKRVHREPTAVDQFVLKLKGYFTGSQLFVSIGILLLTFGAGFLIKLGIDYGLFPLELRIACVGLVGLALLAIGWKLRDKRGPFGLLLQGGGVGLMYMTTFASAKLFYIVPLAAAFALMVILVLLAGMLSVLQNAKPLAFFAAAGGFLAPILTSTGHGNHVMLFSYYAVLNAGILGVAWFKAWRELNLLGYAFTFVIGALWGVNSYESQFFFTTEPFLILFFLFFVAISILFASRQPPNLKGYVDGTLVFGVPIVAFTMQAGLVNDMEYGLAYSAVALSAFYVGLATFLWKRAQENFRLLTESFLSMGVVFGTLAIPLAFDGLWIASAWALEGAALIWIGARQGRLLARIFGMLLQFGAGISLLTVSPHAPDEIPFLNGFLLSAWLLSAAGLFTQYYLQRADRIRPAERVVSITLFVLGLIWWFIPGMMEIDHHLRHEFPGFILFFTATAVLMMIMDSRLDWPLLRIPLFLILPSQALLLIVLRADSPSSNPFAHLGFVAWTVTFIVVYRQLFVYRNALTESYLKWHHPLSFWIATALLSWEGSWVMKQWIADGSSTWHIIFWGLAPAAMIFGLITYGRRIKWPIAENLRWYLWHTCIPVLCWIGLWAAVHAIGNPGNVDPLPYVPLLNPLDLTIGFIALVTLRWRGLNHERPMSAEIKQLVVFGLSAVCFLWLNGMIARTVHHYLGYDYSAAVLWSSGEFQTSISIAWTLLALALMIIAHRHVNRSLWIAGAGLLAAVVIKLFFVELDKTGAVARVVSFMVVGVLMLIIGYFVPLPPKRLEKSS
ncbi:MAG: DUF2339 domain-containing protein [Bacteroidetes bacterium]|nr:DUF2339 domain-containing protein [Bacteroidota bacterium]